MACSLPLPLSSPIFSTLHTVAAYLPSQNRIEKGNYLTRYILKHGTISHSLTHSLTHPSAFFPSLSSADVNDIRSCKLADENLAFGYFGPFSFAH